MDDDGGFGSGLRLILTALASAVLTATLVIAVGRTLIDLPAHGNAHAQGRVTPASG